MPTEAPKECKLTKLREKQGDCSGGDVVGTSNHEATVDGCQEHCNNIRGCNFFIYWPGKIGKNCFPKYTCDKNSGGGNCDAYTVKACKELRAKKIRERMQKEDEANLLTPISTGGSKKPDKVIVVKPSAESLPPRPFGLKLLVLLLLLFGPVGVCVVVSLITRSIAKLLTGQGYNHQAYDATNVS